jgi:hypothetical protein
MTSPNAALAVTHPSHELRAYGWLERAQPRVLVFTDGAGRAGQPRVARTADLLGRLGLKAGEVFGVVTDLEIYAAVLRRDVRFFLGWAEVVARDLAQSEIELLVGDAAEGHNVAHDLWRGVLDAAVDIARDRHGRSIESFVFPLFGHPAACPGAAGEAAVRLELDDAQFARKLAAVRAYSPTLAAELDALRGGEFYAGLIGVGLETLVQFPEAYAQVRKMVADITIDDFRIECLWSVPPFESLTRGPHTPFYEVYGERLVAAGLYREVIRYGAHVAPVLEGLRAWRRGGPVTVP